MQLTLNHNEQNYINVFYVISYSVPVGENVHKSMDFVHSQHV